jgi:HK97 gp10 family phage protein
VSNGNNSFNIGVDTSGLDSLLETLGSAASEVVRPAAHAGALVLYTRAKLLAPVFAGGPKFIKRSNSGKSGGYWIKPGQLRDSIYRVYSKDNSGDGVATYHISWNHKKAPHGHWIENGNAKHDAKSFIRRAYVEQGDAAAEAAAASVIQEITKRLG